MGVIVTAASGFDLEYDRRGQAAGAERTAGGYYMNAAQAGEATASTEGAQALKDSLIRWCLDRSPCARSGRGHRKAAT
jgi:hypothetical protein